jgi:hypothetical protein
MGYHPDTIEQGSSKAKKVVQVAKQAIQAVVKAQAADPVGTALWPFLMAVEIALLLGHRVRGELWGILLTLALLKAHTWVIDNGHRSTLLMFLLGRIPKKKSKS